MTCITCRRVAGRDKTDVSFEKNTARLWLDVMFPPYLSLSGYDNMMADCHQHAMDIHHSLSSDTSL